MKEAASAGDRDDARLDTRAFMWLSMQDLGRSSLHFVRSAAGYTSRIFPTGNHLEARPAGIHLTSPIGNYLESFDAHVTGESYRKESDRKWDLGGRPSGNHLALGGRSEVFSTCSLIMRRAK